MNTIEKSRVKNAPLTPSEEESEFVSWSMSVPDGCIAAGWRPVHPRRVDDRPGQVLRNSGAKLVSLVRRESNQTPEQVAAAAGVPVSDVVALEHGDDVAGETVTRVAGVLRLDTDVLIQLFGFTEVFDPRLVDAAREFVLNLEASEPLQPREIQALGKFRDTLLNHPDRKHVG